MPKKVGRPKAPENAKKVKNFTFRAGNDLHEKLRLASQSAARSVSEEIAVRLERSFDPDLNVEKVFASPAMFALVRALSVAMERAGRQAAQLKTFPPAEIATWFRDPYAFHQAVAAAERLLEKFRPEGDPKAPFVLGDDTRNSYAKSVGNSEARRLAIEIGHAVEGTIGARLRRDLDPANTHALKDI